MEYTGERYLPWVDDAQTSYEHWHRYLVAMEYAKGKDVLDVASGEGYGSYLLAQVARRVTGVDISKEAVAHASSRYVRRDLSFSVGTLDRLPFVTNDAYDLIVSFETIEHAPPDQQERFLAEVKRVLRPAGVLIASTPNKLAYSDLPGYVNPYHAKEFYVDEFREFLSRQFRFVRFMGQKVYPASYVWPEDEEASGLAEYRLTHTDQGVRPTSEPKEVRYIIAICSDEPLPKPKHSLAVDLSSVLLTRRDDQIAALGRSLVERDARLQTLDNELLRAVEESSRKQEAVDTLSAQLVQSEQQVQALAARVAAGKEQVEAMTAQVTAGGKLVEAMTAQVTAGREQVEAMTAELLGITTGRAWKLAMFLRQMRRLLVPSSGLGLLLPRRNRRVPSHLDGVHPAASVRSDLQLIRQSGFFDKGWYLAHNPDVAQAKVDPELHFLLCGGLEGRDPSPLFSSRWYLDTYPDVREAGVQPLLHYLRQGRGEGRLARPDEHVSAPPRERNRAAKKPLPGLVRHAMRAIAVWRSEGPTAAWRKVVTVVNGAVGARLSLPANNVTLAPSAYRDAYATFLDFARSEKTDEYVPPSDADLTRENLPVKLIAFYLPQFHPIPENDAWWGKGFTEWTNVSKAVPQFLGHYQPHLPGDLGFYDLRVPDVLRRQVELAAKHGVHGFCFYYYWFNGTRLLYRPIEQYASDPQIDFPFCVCWANENWTRRWDGLDDEILLAQEYSSDSYLAFIRDLDPLLRHKNYIRVGARPLLIVYRAQALPDPTAAAKIWRTYCQETGLGDVYLVAGQTFGFWDPRRIGFDAAVEFPPHNLSLQDINRSVAVLNPDYSGRVYRYTDMVAQMTGPSRLADYTLFKTVSPGWDNEPRRPGRGHSLVLSTPHVYKHWLREVCDLTTQRPDDGDRLVFINAWNEWAEGAHLEPDRRYGYAYLRATADVLRQLPREPEHVERRHPIIPDPEKRHDTAVILHLFYEDLWDEIAAYLAILEGRFDLYVSTPETSVASLDRVRQAYPNTFAFLCENRGRDIAPFLEILGSISPFGYKYVCKLHTKKSTHREDGQTWRADILDKLLGSSQRIEAIKNALAISDVGMVAPQGHLLSSDFYWGSNAEGVKRLARRFNIPYIGHFRFIAGSMFWFKPESLYPLTLAGMSPMDFEPEKGQIDGTLAHAFERFFGLLPLRTGYRILEAGPQGVREPLVRSEPKYYPFADRAR